MNYKKLFLYLVLIDFVGLTGFAIYQDGTNIFSLILGNWVTIQILADVTIALTLALIWMYHDTRQTGLSFVPYLLLTICTGSIGLLIYLIRRESVKGTQAGMGKAVTA